MSGRGGPRALAPRLLALAAVVTALVAGTGVVQATPRATTTPDVVPVRLTSMTPVAGPNGASLVVTGTVTNTDAVAVTSVEVGLRVSPTPVHSRDEIPQILSGDAGRSGNAVSGSRVPVVDSLAPGETAPFRITMPWDQLGLPANRAEVAVLGVESLGQVSQDGQGTVQTGFTRVFLPWFPATTAVTPTPVVWLFPLTSAPSRGAGGVFLDDHLAAEVGPRGRLTRLLDAATAAPLAVSWVVDPALLQSLEDMTDGYRVRGPHATTVPGTGGPSAVLWLARLRSLVAGADVTASSYADPDVVALHRAGLDVDVALAATTARDLPARLLATPVSGGLAWPPGQVTDDGTLDVLRASGTRAIVLTAASLPPTAHLTYTPSGSVDLATGGSPLRAVVSDPTISTLVAAPAKGDGGAVDPIVRRQEALAEMAMMTLELPSTPRTLVIAPSSRWNPYSGTAALVAATTSAWARPSSLTALLAAPASDVPRSRTDYPASARAAELPRVYLSRVRAARTSLAALRAVAPDTASGSTRDLEETLTRADSAAWRTNQRGGLDLITSVTSIVDAQTAKVSILSRAPVTLPGDEGIIPITIANDLDRPARVGVRLVGTPATRFSADAIPAVTLAPGQKATLEVKAQVVGTEPVTVAIGLVTPDGATFGTPVVTQVKSAAYAHAAQGAVIGLFAILVVLLGINFVRRRRTPAGSSAQDAA